MDLSGALAAVGMGEPRQDGSVVEGCGNPGADGQCKHLGEKERENSTWRAGDPGQNEVDEQLMERDIREQDKRKQMQGILSDWETAPIKYLDSSIETYKKIEAVE